MFSRLKEKNLGKEIGIIVLLLFRPFVASFLELLKFDVKIILVRTEAIAYSSKKRIFHIIYNNVHNNHYLISVLYGQKTIELYVYKYIYKYNFTIIIIICKKDIHLCPCINLFDITTARSIPFGLGKIIWGSCDVININKICIIITSDLGKKLRSKKTRNVHTLHSPFETHMSKAKRNKTNDNVVFSCCFQ